MFPVSDFLHTVVTPAMLLMGQFLALSHVQTPKDVAAGLFICNVLYHVRQRPQQWCLSVSLGAAGGLPLCVSRRGDVVSMW